VAKEAIYIYLLVPSQDKERKRNGINIESEIRITNSQALAGCEISVKTMVGMKTIVVPPNTKSGDVLVLKGYGTYELGVSDKSGNHVIKFICE
jgi:DnaJ-class molecular chaperone